MSIEKNVLPAQEVPMSLKFRRYPFYIGITTLVVTIVVVLTGVFLWINDKESSSVALNLADRIFSEVNEKMTERYGNALESVDPTGRKRFFCKTCNVTHYKNPTVGVAVILVKDTEILLVRRLGSYEKMWCIPCGHLEWDGLAGKRNI